MGGPSNSGGGRQDGNQMNSTVFNRKNKERS